MTRLGRALRISIIGVLVVSLAVPAPLLAAPVALGMARGVRSAELSLDGGTSWLSLKGRSLPLMLGARIRSTTGAVAIELAGGDRLDLMPFSAASFEAPGEVALEYGRVAFRLTPGSRLVLPASGARLEPAGGEPAAGEAVAVRSGAAGARVTLGSLAFSEPGAAPRLVRAGGGPVYVPRGLPASDVLFDAGVAASPRTAVRAVFTPQGENVGYLAGGSRLVVQPGFAADLRAPFPTRTVQQASSKVPPESRAGALVLLDANGGYVGYIAGATFFAPSAAAAAAAAAGDLPGARSGSEVADAGWPWHYTVGLLVITGGILGLGIAATINDDEDKPASPVAP